MYVSPPTLPSRHFGAAGVLSGQPIGIAPAALEGYLARVTGGDRAPRRKVRSITEPPPEYLAAIAGQRTAPPRTIKRATQPATAGRKTKAADMRSMRAKLNEARFSNCGPAELRAIHEAGHIAVAVALGVRPISATVEGAGHALYDDPHDAEKTAAIKAAGAAAETLIGGNRVCIQGTDYQDAVAAVGKQNLAGTRERADALLASRRGLVLDLAGELLQRRTLDGAALRAIVARHEPRGLL